MGYYHNGRIRREEVRLQRPEEYLWKPRPVPSDGATMVTGRPAAKMQTQGVIMEQDVVSKIESGDRLVTDYEVRAFAAVFGVAFENLIEDEE